MQLVKEERILNLIAFLLSARKPVPWEKIRGVVSGFNDDASRSTLERRFERDKKEMRALGIPLVFVSGDAFGREGYYIDRARYFLPEIELDTEEAMLLSVACIRAQETAGRAVAEQAGRALRKLACVNPLLAEAAEEVEGAFKSEPPETKTADYDANLDTFTASLSEYKRVKITYATVGAKPLVRVIRPYGLGYRSPDWYVVAYCEKRRGIRMFSLARIKGRARFATETEEPEYDIPEDFDVKEYVGRDAWGFGPPGAGEKYEVRFDPSIAWLIEEYRFTGGTYKIAANGSGLLKLPVKNPVPLYRFLAPFGGKARIMKPEKARDELRAKLKKTLSRYAAKGGRR